MADSFPFQLVTPTGVVFEGQVGQVTAVGALGEFGVLAMHTNYITSLRPGMLSILRSDGKRDDYLISGGLAEVKDGRMTVLASDTEVPGKQDAAQAAHDAEVAEERLGHMSSYDPEFVDVEHDLQLARARQSAASFKSSSR